MWFRSLVVGLVAVVTIISSSAQTKADVLYSNGTSAYGSGYYIDGSLSSGSNEAVAFLVTAPVSLTDMQLVLFTQPGKPMPSTISWCVGKQPFTSSVASGTATGATLDVSFLGDRWGWSLYNATISFAPNVSVPSALNPYYLSLFGAAAGTGWENSLDGVKWSCVGNSTSYATNGYPPYYIIDGNPTPEPTTLALLVSALLGYAGVVYLRRRRAKT